MIGAISTRAERLGAVSSIFFDALIPGAAPQPAA
jgi:hypothetical protein